MYRTVALTHSTQKAQPDLETSFKAVSPIKLPFCCPKEKRGHSPFAAFGLCAGSGHVRPFLWSEGSGRAGAVGQGLNGPPFRAQRCCTDSKCKAWHARQGYFHLLSETRARDRRGETKILLAGVCRHRGAKFSPREGAAARRALPWRDGGCKKQGNGSSPPLHPCPHTGQSCRLCAPQGGNKGREQPGSSQTACAIRSAGQEIVNAGQVQLCQLPSL